MISDTSEEKNESNNISVHEESTSTGGFKNNIQDFKKKFTNDNSNIAKQKE